MRLVGNNPSPSTAASTCRSTTSTEVPSSSGGCWPATRMLDRAVTPSAPAPEAAPSNDRRLQRERSPGGSWIGRSLPGRKFGTGPSCPASERLALLVDDEVRDGVERNDL